MKKAIQIIPEQFRRRGIGVACTLFLRAVLNMVGLAMLLPVLALALDPQSMEGDGWMATIYHQLGFHSTKSFALAGAGFSSRNAIRFSLVDVSTKPLISLFPSLALVCPSN